MKDGDFDLIREELNRIIHESPKDVNEKADQTKPKLVHFKNKISPERMENLENSEAAKNASYLHSTVLHTIDDDIQKMRSELKESYQLFQAAGEAFESINFNCLQQRIRDFHLSASVSEIDGVMREKSVKDRLDRITDMMGDRMKPLEELQDIPELNAFFSACDQLHAGLGALKRHRTDMDELGERMNWATKVSEDRTAEIRSVIEEK